MRDDDTLYDGHVPGSPAARPDDAPALSASGDPRPVPGTDRRAPLVDRWRTRLLHLRLPGVRWDEPGHRFRVLGERARRARMVLVVVVCCLGLPTCAQAGGDAADVVARVDPVVDVSEFAQRTEDGDRTSRGLRRADVPDTGRDVVFAPADPDTASAPATGPTPQSPTARPEPVDPGPVAGLTGIQMDNAKAIVRTGRDMGMPRRALIIAVATAMQESDLHNLASGVLPESQDHPHQGVGWDHDSVGLFQQRSSSGWGPVGRLMDPAYATSRFLGALQRVPDWQQMRLTDAAQAVQVSAYPEHYAKHEGRATQVVDAIVPGWE